MNRESNRAAFVVLFVGLLIPVSAYPAKLTLEAENFVTYHDIDYKLIQKYFYEGCSSGFMLVGLDAPSEWTQYHLPVPGSFGTYNVIMKCRGDASVPYVLQLILTSDSTGADQTIDFSFQGVGYG